MPEQNIQRKLASGLVWTFAESASAKIVNFLVTLILARLLMPEEYGTVAIVNVLIAFLDVFVISGMGSALIQKKNADTIDFSTITWFSLVVAFVLYGLLYTGSYGIAVFFNSMDLVLILKVMGLKLFLSAINSVQHAYVSKHLLFKSFFYATTIGTIISAIVSIIMAYHGYGVWALVAQQLLNSILNTLIIRFIIPWRLQLVFSFERFKELFTFGWKLLFSSLLDTLYNEIVSLSIGKKYSKADLAYYDKGKQIPETISTVIARSMNKALFPTMAKVQQDTEQIKDLARNNTRVTGMFMYPILIFFIVTAHDLICCLFTEKWEEASFYIQILSVFYLIKPFSSINLAITKALGRSDILLKNNFIRKVLGIFVILVMVFLFDSPRYVVCGVLITGVVDVIINMTPNKKLIGYSVLGQIGDTIPFLIISIILGCFIYFISSFFDIRWLRLVIQTLLFFCMYIATLYVIGNKTMAGFLGYLKKMI